MIPPIDKIPNLQNANNSHECQSCKRTGLDTCMCPDVERLVLVSISAGIGCKIALFVTAKVLPDGRYIIKESTFNKMLDKINVGMGEGIYT